MDLSGKWVKIYTVESIFEEDVIKDALNQEDIEFTVKEYKDTAYDGLFVLQKGYASILVREGDVEKTKAVIGRLKTIPYVAFSKE